MFITLEGPEGSGKTSQMKPLAAYLRQLGEVVYTTREPGGSPIGDEIRNILLNMKNQEMHLRTEILLFQASRAQHVEQVIRPRLQRGEIVLCDRYADSTLAYQGYGYQLFELSDLEQIVRFATGGLKPDLTLLFDLDVEIGLRRRARGGDLNRLDAYQVAFYERVRAGYHRLAAAEPGRWVVIEAGASFEDVQQSAREAIRQRLEQSR